MFHHQVGNGALLVFDMLDVAPFVVHVGRKTFKNIFASRCSDAVKVAENGGDFHGYNNTRDPSFVLRLLMSVPHRANALNVSNLT